MASRQVIIVAEEIVPEDTICSDPNRILLPSFHVGAVVHERRVELEGVQVDVLPVEVEGEARGGDREPDGPDEAVGPGRHVHDALVGGLVRAAAVGVPGDPPGAGRLRDPKAFVGYVRIITRNKFVDRLKQRLRHHEKDRLPWDDASQEAVAPSGEERDEELWSVVRGLPEEQRLVIEGVYLEGKTYQEVSDDTGIPLGTMKRRLREGWEFFSFMARRRQERGAEAT